MSGHWICPHCEHATYVTKELISSGSVFMAISNFEGPMASSTAFVVCPNPNCARTTVTLTWGNGVKNSPYTAVRWIGAPHTLRVNPPSYARALAAVVPVPVVEDYREACGILDLSPKAAATLARRALQGMIRDFHQIVRPNLHQEILALREIVDSDLWAAIDAVRSVGNIGAHMEADINLILDVDPGESLQLIRLIELLSHEWYATRENRKRQLAELTELAVLKKAERALLKAGSDEGTEVSES